MFPPYRNRQRRRQAAIPLELTRQLSPMHQASRRASRAIEAVVHTHQQAAELYTKTLAEGEQIVEEAKRALTSYQQEALNHYQIAYYYEMLATVEATATEIVDTVIRLTAHQEGHDGTD
jgi:hypothetical protein